MKKNKKLGYQAPIGYRINRFSYVQIESYHNNDVHMAYCRSHKFIYNVSEEEKKLYNAQPCHYTDTRFTDSFNSYGVAHIYDKRFKPISKKACVRRVLNCKNIPVNTIVHFTTNFTYRSKNRKHIRPDFKFKVRKVNHMPINYEINDPAYFDNFTTCPFGQQLTNALRANGFIVGIYKENDNFISSMLSTAAVFTTGKYTEPRKEEGEVAIAYGHGKKIGFSSYNNTIFGYGYGIHDILWATFGNFNKWSDCRQIPKTTSIDEIIAILKTPNPPDED